MCGVTGVYLKDSSLLASNMLYHAGRTLQDRGEESTSMITADERFFYSFKAVGQVASAYPPVVMKQLKGPIGALHTRYPTAGSRDLNTPEDIENYQRSVLKNAPPFIDLNPSIVATTKYDMRLFEENKRFGIMAGFVHNGDVEDSVYQYMKRQYEGLGIGSFESESDVEVYSKTFSAALLSKKGDNLNFSQRVFDASKYLMEHVQGGYSLVGPVKIGDEVKLVAMRDAHGIRPLSYAEDDKMVMFSSESATLEIFGLDNITEVQPGEVVQVGKDGLVKKRVVQSPKRTCMFEKTWFSRTDSIIDGLSNYKVRFELGERLAERDMADGTIDRISMVVPVLMGGDVYADGYSCRSGIQKYSALYAARSLGRSFTKASGAIAHVVRLKQNPIREMVVDENILLTDDSLVRGNTTIRTTEALFDAGAHSVHWRFGTPKLLHPCYWGIDMKTLDQFLARDRTEEQIVRMWKEAIPTAGEITLKYSSIEDLTDVVGKEICTHCLDGVKPFDSRIVA